MVAAEVADGHCSGGIATERSQPYRLLVGSARSS